VVPSLLTGALGSSRVYTSSVIFLAYLYVYQMGLGPQALVFNMTQDLITIAERKAVKRAKKKDSGMR
jgi:hypothetical protein